MDGEEEFRAEEKVMASYTKKSDNQIENAVDGISGKYDHQRVQHCQKRQKVKSV
jgi:hypothetical protein